LAEAIWVLGSVYQLKPREQATAVEMLLNHKDLTVQDADGAVAALETFRSKADPRIFRLLHAAFGAESRSLTLRHV